MSRLAPVLGLLMIRAASETKRFGARLMNRALASFRPKLLAALGVIVLAMAAGTQTSNAFAHKSPSAGFTVLYSIGHIQGPCGKLAQLEAEACSMFCGSVLEASGSGLDDAALTATTIDSPAQAFADRSGRPDPYPPRFFV